jgi:integration host factor subunit alpha
MNWLHNNLEPSSRMCDISLSLNHEPLQPIEGESSMSTLTKAQIVENLFSKNLFTKGESTRIIETLFELMKQTLENGEDVLISGFGKFSVHEKHGRRGRNPQTGEPIMLDPRKVVTFKCSGVLREKINEEAERAEEPTRRRR